MTVFLAAVAAFLLVAAASLVLLVVIAIRREDRWGSGPLPEVAREPLTRLARGLSGLYIRRSQPHCHVDVRADTVLGGDEEDPQPKSILL